MAGEIDAVRGGRILERDVLLLEELVRVEGGDDQGCVAEGGVAQRLNGAAVLGGRRCDASSIVEL